MLLRETFRISRYIPFPLTMHGGARLLLSGIPGVKPPVARVPLPTTASVVVVARVHVGEVLNVVGPACAGKGLTDKDPVTIRITRKN